MLQRLLEPRNLRLSCSGGDTKWTVTLRWSNTEPDQTGVRVYRNNQQIATLGASAKTYTNSFVHRPKQGEVTFGVQAYKGQLVSGIVSASVRRCQ